MCVFPGREGDASRAETGSGSVGWTTSFLRCESRAGCSGCGPRRNTGLSLGSCDSGEVSFLEGWSRARLSLWVIVVPLGSREGERAAPDLEYWVQDDLRLGGSLLGHPASLAYDKMRACVQGQGKVQDRLNVSVKDFNSDLSVGTCTCTHWGH